MVDIGASWALSTIYISTRGLGRFRKYTHLKYSIKVLLQYFYTCKDHRMNFLFILIPGTGIYTHRY